ncbi:serine/arginine repetitive matrix protein 1 [Phalaenopsis equestris]|uniref:serine/arginine repetitive matrix protein 1 n=1 Tax=Phalaenopsis equestris TaxID=78828 RepID=UPI0009E2828C|nr:serine/arginine repetitive matrix protein 1 [Phalaenopsis equestris]
MSGGFFRGTSADQDTRFSNKQAKLLKSQKFAPELDQLVDMTKVKMDVIRPWIATRATELLGFEDEVLINFVYGLLDGKVVDGKKIQIQLTGFMEKNTGKFMKELWTLLLSAQNNVSGVPQQFLDAKEEEQRKKKEENDRVSQEIQKRKERAGRELEREKLARMEEEGSDSKSHKSIPDLVSGPWPSSGLPEEERKEDGIYNHKTRNGHSISPYENDPSPPSRRSSPSEARSSSRERHKSRSASVYSESPRHSISPKRRNLSPVKRSTTPIRHYRSPHRHPTSRSPPRRTPHSRSPARRRSPHSRRRSISPSRDRYSSSYFYGSHARRKSPYMHRRSPSPSHRSPSPVRRRSPPLRRRSPSPVYRRSRSPPRRRSPTYHRRRSPSPFRHRSPFRRRSPSPARNESISPIRRSPLTLSSKYRKPSPPRSPVRRVVDSYNSPRQRNRSPIPHRSESPLNHRDLNKVHNNLTDRDKSRRPCDERIQRRLSTHQNLLKESDNYVGSDKSPKHSKFQAGKSISSQKKSRSLSPSRSPVVLRAGSVSRHGSSETSREEEKIPRSRDVVHHKDNISRKQSTYPPIVIENSYGNDHIMDVRAPSGSVIAEIPATRHILKSEIKQNDMGDRLKGNFRHSQSQADIEYGPGGTRGGKNRLEGVLEGKSPEERKNKGHTMSSDAHLGIGNVQSISKGTEYEETRYEREHGKRPKRKFDKDQLLLSNYSDSDVAQKIEKQLKRSDSYKRNISESSENDSQFDEKKEAKRRRKEERRLRKEEKYRMREERRRRRAERPARQKVRTMDDLSPSSDFEKHLSDANDSDHDAYRRKNSHTTNAKEAESEQKRLEIELRMKALESLRAKKAIND